MWSLEVKQKSNSNFCRIHFHRRNWMLFSRMMEWKVYNKLYEKSEQIIMWCMRIALCNPMKPERRFKATICICVDVNRSHTKWNVFNEYIYLPKIHTKPIPILKHMSILVFTHILQCFHIEPWRKYLRKKFASSNYFTHD